MVSKETLRKWMTEDGLWVPHARRRDRVHQPRHRRSCTGELIQIDGCDHEWFEARSERCTLLVYIDDATSKLMELSFCDAESTFNYFDATRKYLGNHGKPVAFYSDKAAVFRVNRPEPQGGDGVTQYGRAQNDLNIDIICANSAPAKGRVERANLTLQDRLVKELRLNGISSVDAANASAPGFIADYNARFSNAPTFNYRRQLFLPEDTEATRTLAGKRLTVYELNDGEVLAMTSFAKEEAQIPQGAIVSNKRLSGVLQQIKEKQAMKDSENLAKARTKRDKHLPLQRIKATG